MKYYLSKKLNVDIEIINIIFEIFEIYEQRAKSGEYKNIVFEVRTKEQGHNRAHIHASYNHQFEISISIDDKIEVIAGNLPMKQQTEALNWVKINIDKLRKQWNNYHFDYQIPMIASALNFND